MTFKVEAGKRYVRRDGSVMEQSLKKTNPLCITFMAEYPFFDPETGTYYKESGHALKYGEASFDLVSLYEELDLTKPLRIRRDAIHHKYSGERFYYSGVNSPNGFLVGFVLDKNGSPWGKFMRPEELENIPPEPVKHVYYLYFNEADKGASLYAHNNYSPLFKPSMAKILIWVEEGKTKVEVCDD